MLTAAAAPTPTRPGYFSGLRLLTLTLILAAFALRLYHLGGESLWYDETVSAYLAFQSPTALIAHTARDIHPPAYYLLLHLWQQLTAPTPAFGLEFLLAWPSLWFGMLSLALTAALARRWGDPQAVPVALAAGAIQPFQLWAAQEVRMYAVGAFLVLLTLWALLPWLVPAGAPPILSRPHRLLYILAAALGLYTLYYFAFWLVVLNLCLIFAIWRAPRLRLQWLVANGLVLLLWLPWLPIFIRQAVTPPVPPWRTAWQLPADLFHALVEGLAAQLVAHTVPLARLWPWAVLALLLYAAVIDYTKDRRGILLVGLGLGPFLLLVLASILGAPIYHVRYLATYAPLFPLAVGLLAVRLPVRAAWLVLLPLILPAALSIRALWVDPRYAADDHRHAVADLAANWRPGDAILVNAGWVYPALAVYWPRELSGPQTTLPPDLYAFPRLTGALDDATLASGQAPAPVVYRTGSVNGPDLLGWGLAESDFYAMPLTDATRAFARLDERYARLWHYRLYDTVSDPQGQLRAWLDAEFPRTWEQTYTGPGFLRVERYELADDLAPPQRGPTITYTNDIRVVISPIPAQITAGSYLYTDLWWESAADAAPVNLAASLRLYDASDVAIAQVDAALPPLSSTAPVRQPLALPIPASTPPGTLHLGLILYDPATLAPVALASSAATVEGAVELTQIQVSLPPHPPIVPHIRARFDYIDLVSVALPTPLPASAGEVTTRWTWRPRASTYRDDYTARLLIGRADELLAEFPLGTPDYPSSAWAAGYPVSHTAKFRLPGGLAPGSYPLRLQVVRTADGKVIPPRTLWSWAGSETYLVGEWIITE